MRTCCDSDIRLTYKQMARESASESFSRMLIETSCRSNLTSNDVSPRSAGSTGLGEDWLVDDVATGRPCAGVTKGDEINSSSEIIGSTAKIIFGESTVRTTRDVEVGPFFAVV